MKKDLLKLLDLSGREIEEILNIADQLKYEQKNGISHDFPKGKTLAMVFEKSSTRTRVSFEAGIFQLGGHGIFLSSAESQLGRGEPMSDTARVLSRYCDGIMIRTYSHDTVEELAKYADVPVINGLSELYHPCQVLADLMTIREHKTRLAGLKAAYVGDGNNMANSIIVGCLKCGMEVTAACPEGYDPVKEVLEYAADKIFTLTREPEAAVKGADVVFTDVWASMGHESEAEARRVAFAGYQVNDEIMALANPGCMVQHCLPAHRGEEITEEILEAHANEIFDESENRLHAQKAVMYLLMK